MTVLSGDDQVLKLMDSRIRRFFKFACTWQPATTLPVTMKTGRLQHWDPYKAKRESFYEAAKAEALKIGYSFYAQELAEAGYTARNVLHLVSTVHGSVLDKIVAELAGC